MHQPCPDPKPHTRHERLEDNIVRQDCPGRCAHCARPLRGSGTALDGSPLCHPDDGMDCYHLVTLYRHPMPCDCPIDDDEFAAFNEVLQSTREGQR